MKIHSGQQPKFTSFCKTNFLTKLIFSPLSNSHFTTSVIISSWLGPEMLLPSYTTLEMHWCNCEQNLIQSVKVILKKLSRYNNYFAWTTNKQY